MDLQPHSQHYRHDLDMYEHNPRSSSAGSTPITGLSRHVIQLQTALLDPPHLQDI